MVLSKVAFGLAAAALVSPALAHTGSAEPPGFAAGLAHPLSGGDHVLAMAAVGVWAGLAGGRARWAWPLAFLTVMLAGALLATQGVDLRGFEAAVALSVLALGLAVAVELRLTVALGAAVCGLFALFHGYAHGVELPRDVEAARYVLGFCLATLLLHAFGLAIGALIVHLQRPSLGRLLGGAVAAAGLVLLAA